MKKIVRVPAEVGLDEDGADAAVRQAHVTDDADGIGRVGDAGIGGRAWRLDAKRRRQCGQQRAVLQVEGRHAQVVARTQRCQRRAGVAGILERQRRGTVLADDRRNRLDLLRQRRPRGRGVVHHEADARQQQRGGGGDDEHERQLAAKGVAEHRLDTVLTSQSARPGDQ